MANRKIKNMEEFSAVSGISRPTVSKYFNDPGSVRPTTRARIEKALAQYDYRPNIYAMNQNRQLTKNVGILVPYLADPFFAEIARRIEQRCLAAGFIPTLFSAHGDPRLEIDVLETIRAMKPAGALLAPLGRGSDRDAVAQFCADVPTVLFDSNIDGIGDIFVGLDNPSSVAMIVEYLHRTGEAPTFFEMEQPANPNAHKRHDSYVRTMERLGYDPQIVRVPGEGWDFEAIGYAGALDVIDRGQLPTKTILCSNDRLAIGFLAAAYERGLKVGHAAGCDIRVAGHDDHPYSRFTCPSLTTVAQDYDSISSRSVEALLGLLENGRPDMRAETLFEGKLIMRASA